MLEEEVKDFSKGRIDSRFCTGTGICRDNNDGRRRRSGYARQNENNEEETEEIAVSQIVRFNGEDNVRQSNLCSNTRYQVVGRREISSEKRLQECLRTGVQSGSGRIEEDDRDGLCPFSPVDNP